MALPVVAIIGRPNVGKSSLFNAIAGRRISIVDPIAGVTRDRVNAIIEYEQKFFELVDTGGYGIVDRDDLTEHIKNQIHRALAQAGLVLFVVDIRDGITPLDQTVAQMLRKQNLPLVLVANKADTAAIAAGAGDFVRLGFGHPVCVSAKNNVNKAELLDRITTELKDLPCEKPGAEVMKIAVVGKRNAGKSTLINSIVGEERVIVSEVPGTTRDAIDVRFERNGKQYLAIDTAGVRKKSSITDSLEFYSFTRASQGILRADVVLFLIDSTEKLSQVDKKLGEFISQNYKACILVVNKWDLAKDSASTDDYHAYITKVLPALSYAPIAFTTAKEGKNVQSLLDLASEIFKLACSKISTPALNRAIAEIAARPASGSRRKSGLPRIYYATQVASLPVSLLLFVNNPRLFDQTYQRFIINRLREHLGIEELPVRLLLRARR